MTSESQNRAPVPRAPPSMTKRYSSIGKNRPAGQRRAAEYGAPWNSSSPKPRRVLHETWPVFMKKEKQNPTKELYRQMRALTCDELWENEVARFDRAAPRERE